MARRYVKNAVASAVLVALLAVSHAGGINDLTARAPVLGDLDQRAGDFYDASLTSALSTFALARGLNALISIIQETKISLAPLGMGTSLAVGEILDPLNDLLEQFSWILLVSTASLAMQKVLLQIGAWLGFQVLLTLSLLVLLVALWLPGSRRARWLRRGYRLLIVSFVVRFCIPVLALATGEIYDLFLKQKAQEARLVMEETRAAVDPGEIAGTGGKPEEETAGSSGQPRPGLWERMTNLVGSTPGASDWKAGLAELDQRIEEMLDRLSGTAEHIVDLITVFLVQTVLVPIGVLWALVRLAGFLTGKAFFPSLAPKGP